MSGAQCKDLVTSSPTPPHRTPHRRLSTNTCLYDPFEENVGECLNDVLLIRFCIAFKALASFMGK